MKRTDTLSKAISLMQIPAVAIIILLHSYTTARGEISETNSTIYYYISYLLSMEIGNMGVPLYFTISGILFFNNYINIYSYKTKIKSRIKTLVTPYFCWNLITLMILLVLQNIEVTRTHFSGNNKLILDYSITDFLKAFWDKGSGTPVLSPYWYIRNLFILQLFSPIIFIFIQHLKTAYLIIVFGVWIITPTLTFTYTSIFYFSLGAYFSIHDIDLVKMTNLYFKPLIIFFMVILGTEIFLHFNVASPLLIYLQKVLFITGVLCFFALAIKAVQHNISISTSLIQASFFIYTTHYPIIQGIRRISLKIVNKSPSEIGNVCAYLGSAILAFFICLFLYKCMKSLMPKTLAFITGERS